MVRIVSITQQAIDVAEKRDTKNPYALCLWGLKNKVFVLGIKHVLVDDKEWFLSPEDWDRLETWYFTDEMKPCVIQVHDRPIETEIAIN